MEKRLDLSGHEIRDDWVPRGEFVDPEVAALEQDYLWPFAWQMVCRETELENVGDFVKYDILDDTILVLRTGEGRDDVIAVYNVCQHRGRKLMLETSGNIGGRISCKFHGWQYDGEGNLVAVPFAEDFEGCPAFDMAKLGLPRIRVERWGGWWWINQNLDAEPLLDWLGEVPGLIDPFEPERMRPLWWKTLNAPVRWKSVLEAFNESYHAIPTHNSAIIYTMHAPTRTSGLHGCFWFGPPLGPTRYKDPEGKWVTAKTTAETLWAAHKVLDDMLYAMTLEPTMEAARRLKAEAPDDYDPMAVINRFAGLQQDEFKRRGIEWPAGLTPEAIEKAGVSWHVFPNTIVLPTIDGALWYRFRPHPTDPEQCITDIWSLGRFAPGEEPQVENQIYDGFAAFEGQNPFLEEDFPNIAASNQGQKCRGWKGAVINPKQESTVSHFHRNLAEFVRRNRR